MITSLNVIEKSIKETLINELDKIGLLYRIFSRSKDKVSIEDKIERKIQIGKPYSENGKKIQDAIGVRIVTYFRDDVDLVKEIISNKIKILDEEIDKLDSTVFKPKRTNIICKFSKNESDIFNELKKSQNTPSLSLIDNTFELQLRTILSEGWHEIDHSLRYKCKGDWDGHNESERMLNGIYASLETNDIALKNLFHELAYKHFKSNNWEALIRNKFRLKFQLVPLKEELKSILDDNKEIGKKIVKLDRHKVLTSISQIDNSFPVNLNNLIYIINEKFIKDKKIKDITPSIIKEYT